MVKQVDIAVVGALSTVGETLLEVLQQRDFPVATLYPLDKGEAVGSRLSFKDKTLMVQDLTGFDFGQIQLAFFVADTAISAKYAPKAAATGCVVIDRTPQFRFDEDVPLVVPEVNPHAIADYKQRNIIANPSCSTIQMLVALKPLHDAAGITRINVATYQAVSGGGKQTIEELATQTVNLLNARPIEPKLFSKQIAFNVLPQIDDFQDNGYTREEMKLVWEIQKILEDNAVRVNPTAVRVPVFFGHAVVLHVETRDKLTADAARKLLQHATGIEVMDEHKQGGYPTPVTEASGSDLVYVGRIREDISHARGLDLWVVTDNVRKGAALNGVQIAEILVKDYL